MSYSTEDCKKYLISIYKDTQEIGWKRVKKYKDEEKRVSRDFEYSDGRKVTILETPEGLIDKSLLSKPKDVKKDSSFNPFAQIRGTPTPTYTNKPKKTTEEEKFKNFMNKVVNEKPLGYEQGTASSDSKESKSSLDIMKEFLKEQENKKNNPQQDLNDFFSMSSMPSIFIEAIENGNSPLDAFIPPPNNIVTRLLTGQRFIDMNTNEEKFLYVLVNGTQWEENKGNQASTDFYFNIKKEEKESFIKNLIDKEVDLPNMYLIHIMNIAVIVEAQDEGYIPFHVMEGAEALMSMNSILKDIISIYQKNDKKVVFDPKVTEGSLYTLESLKDLCSMNDAGDQWKRIEIEDELDNLINLIKSKSNKKGMKP